MDQSLTKSELSFRYASSFKMTLQALKSDSESFVHTLLTSTAVNVNSNEIAEIPQILIIVGFLIRCVQHRNVNTRDLPNDRNLGDRQS